VRNLPLWGEFVMFDPRTCRNPFCLVCKKNDA